jgi:DUF4097 and DUF4098 domain-containing protein YvlB
MTITESNRLACEPPTVQKTRSSTPSSTRSAARTAWLVLGGLLVVASFAWGTFQVVSLLAHEEYTEIDTFAAAEVTTLDLSNGNGRVTVLGTDTDEIAVTAEISEGLRAPRREMRVVDGRLDIDAGCSLLAGTWCQVDLTVQLPAHMAVEIDADNGRVEVRGIDAPVLVRSDNGSVELDRLAGALDARTNNGRVVARQVSSADVRAQSDNGRVELQFDGEPMTVVASSDNGDVEVLLPDTDAVYQVDIGSENGSVDQQVRVDPTSERSITISSDNGNVSVRYGD